MVFSVLKADVAGGLLRKGLPPSFFVLITAVAAVFDGFIAALMAGTALLALIAPQLLMLFNRARRGEPGRFREPHICAKLVREWERVKRSRAARL